MTLAPALNHETTISLPTCRWGSTAPVSGQRLAGAVADVREAAPGRDQGRRGRAARRSHRAADPGDQARGRIGSDGIEVR